MDLLHNRFFGLILTILGYITLFAWFNWKLGLAMFLIHWGSNIENSYFRSLISKK